MIKTTEEICLNNVKYLDAENVEWFALYKRDMKWIPLSELETLRDELKKDLIDSSLIDECEHQECNCIDFMIMEKIDKLFNKLIGEK